MLQSISWYQFFTVIGGLIVAYYFFGAIYFYSSEIKALLKGESLQRKDIIKKPSADPGNLIGKTVSQSPTQEESNPDTDEATENVLMGTVADLVEEVKSVIIKSESLQRDAISPKFRELLSRYSILVDTHYRPTISLFIADTLTDKAGYVIERAEVDTWWPKSNS
ncbi:MAG: hypothetical protein HOP08_00670 [Cyclobacteriaceae bacterium]|nr:hypothetical protein [Cyclobacteriaceae bacterium]